MKINKSTILALLLCTSVAFAYYAQLPRTKAPEGAKVYIISPKDGEVVSSPVKVTFGLEGMGVAPAGVKYEKTGHHHILIDQDSLPDLGMPIPKDEHHVHFGGGQTEATLELAPGKHTLQLLLADELHLAHEPPIVSEKISITVK